jgi:hypothetical protein
LLLVVVMRCGVTVRAKLASCDKTMNLDAASKRINAALSHNAFTHAEYVHQLSVPPLKVNSLFRGNGEPVCGKHDGVGGREGPCEPEMTHARKGAFRASCAINRQCTMVVRRRARFSGGARGQGNRCMWWSVMYKQQCE